MFRRQNMYIVLVYVVVKVERIKEFIEATKINASKSSMESGVVRFDVIQQKDEPNRFILYECYRTEIDAAKHKDTEHYRVWRGKVESMMAEPRQSVKYVNVYPED